MKSVLTRCAFLGVVGAVVLSLGSPSWAVVGSFFLTGHDPDFHASLGGNTTGGININNAAIDFVMDAGFNPFVAGGVNKFLFVESFTPFLPGNTQGVNGIVASGYTDGSDFEKHDSTTLNTELNLLGTKYSAIVVASDHGGNLKQAELDILNTRSTDIIDFLNSGGGLYALAESNAVGGTPNGGHFGFLPFVVSGVPLGQAENNNVVTPFGAGLGLADSDVNGNFSHNVFAGDFGLTPVDLDVQGNILSLAGRGVVTDTGIGGGVPEPLTAALGTMGPGYGGRERPSSPYRLRFFDTF